MRVIEQEEEEEEVQEEEEEKEHRAEEIVCVMCGRGDNEDSLLLCDGCNDGYHIWCMDPPLKMIPNDQWFCGSCIKERQTATGFLPGSVAYVIWEDGQVYRAVVLEKTGRKTNCWVQFEDGSKSHVSRDRIFSTEEAALEMIDQNPALTKNRKSGSSTAPKHPKQPKNETLHIPQGLIKSYAAAPNTNNNKRPSTSTEDAPPSKKQKKSNATKSKSVSTTTPIDFKTIKPDALVYVRWPTGEIFEGALSQKSNLSLLGGTEFAPLYKQLLGDQNDKSVTDAEINKRGASLNLECWIVRFEDGSNCAVPSDRIHMDEESALIALDRELPLHFNRKKKPTNNINNGQNEDSGGEFSDGEMELDGNEKQEKQDEEEEEDAEKDLENDHDSEIESETDLFVPTKKSKRLSNKKMKTSAKLETKSDTNTASNNNKKKTPKSVSLILKDSVSKTNSSEQLKFPRTSDIVNQQMPKVITADVIAQKLQQAAAAAAAEQQTNSNNSNSNSTNNSTTLASTQPTTTTATATAAATTTNNPSTTTTNPTNTTNPTTNTSATPSANSTPSVPPPVSLKIKLVNTSRPKPTNARANPLDMKIDRPQSIDKELIWKGIISWEGQVVGEASASARSDQISRMYTADWVQNLNLKRHTEALPEIPNENLQIKIAPQLKSEPNFVNFISMLETQKLAAKVEFGSRTLYLFAPLRVAGQKLHLIAYFHQSETDKKRYESQNRTYHAPSLLPAAQSNAAGTTATAAATNTNPPAFVPQAAPSFTPTLTPAIQTPPQPTPTTATPITTPPPTATTTTPITPTLTTPIPTTTVAAATTTTTPQQTQQTPQPQTTLGSSLLKNVLENALNKSTTAAPTQTIPTIPTTQTQTPTPVVPTQTTLTQPTQPTPTTQTQPNPTTPTGLSGGSILASLLANSQQQQQQQSQVQQIQQQQQPPPQQPQNPTPQPTPMMGGMASLQSLLAQAKNAAQKNLNPTTTQQTPPTTTTTAPSTQTPSSAFSLLQSLTQNASLAVAANQASTTTTSTTPTTITNQTPPPVPPPTPTIPIISTPSPIISIPTPTPIPIPTASVPTPTPAPAPTLTPAQTQPKEEETKTLTIESQNHSESSLPQLQSPLLVNTNSPKLTRNSSSGNVAQSFLTTAAPPNQHQNHNNLNHSHNHLAQTQTQTQTQQQTTPPLIDKNGSGTGFGTTPHFTASASQLSQIASNGAAWTNSSPQLSTPHTQQIQQTQQTQQTQTNMNTNMNTTNSNDQFLKDIKICLVGFMANEKRIMNVTQSLTTAGAQVFQKIDPKSGLDLVVIHPNVLPRLIEYPQLVHLKLDPKVKFIKGIEYLESCLQARSLLTPQPQQTLFPGGVLVCLTDDVILSEHDIMPKLVDSLSQFRTKLGGNGEFMIKLHKTTLNAISDQQTTNEIAEKAHKQIEQLLTTPTPNIEISKVTDSEESRGNEQTKKEIPSDVLRTAFKLLFLYPQRFRHFVILTTDKKLQHIAEQQLLCFVGFQQWIQFVQSR